MADLGLGTAHNTLANEEGDEEEEKMTTGASSNLEDRERQA